MSRSTVLICDDDPDFRVLVERVLTDEGWDVVGSVDNAVDAVTVARAIHPAAIVLDVSLCGMSGVDAIPDLAAAGSAVVVCTSFPSAEEPARRAGAVAAIDKADLVTLADVLATAAAVSAGPA